jgi:hypothetical protein
MAAPPPEPNGKSHISERHSFNILNWGKVTSAFQEATNTCVSPDLTYREVQAIKPHLPEALAEVRESVAGAVYIRFT